MQSTRLNTLFNVNIERLFLWANNPWRRTSLSLISLLLGFFLASAISTTFGARSEWDIAIAGITVFFTEFISWIFYRAKRQGLSDGAPGRLALTILNSIKIGIIYGMVLEACKLGS
jgi:Protein of unknown function (DUF565)